MRQLWRDIQTHRLVASIFLACWLILWIVSVVTWLYDPNGYSAGMPMGVFFVHLLAPLTAGILAGWWQGNIRGSIKNGVWAGLLYSVLDFVALLVWSGVLIGLGKVDPSVSETMSWWEGVFEALYMGFFQVIIGLVLGAVGGLIAGLLAAVLRRIRG
jgi:hypothetical protein